MSNPPTSFVHRFIAGHGPAAATTLLLLHGTGGNENDLLPLGNLLLPGASVLSPRGKVLENGMPRFFRRLAEGVFDVDDLKRRTHELADFIGEAIAAYSLDPKRIIAVGYSNGANIASSMMLLHPDVLAAAALFRPMVPFVPEGIPDLRGKSVLASGGARDPIAPPEETRRVIALFSSAGANVTEHRHPGGHELGQDDVAATQAWLSAIL